MNTLFNKLIILGHHPDDSDDEKLRKSSLLVMAAPFAFAGLLWGLIYFLNDLTLSGSIPFSYGILSVLSIIHFAKTTRYAFFRNSQLFLILILPFTLQISLGGFIPGSAVIMWAIIAPTGALIFHSKKRSLIWFAAYIILVVIAYLINDLLPDYFSWDLQENFINALFLMNVFGVSFIVFMIQFYFVSKQTELKEDIQNKNKQLHKQSEKLKELDELKSNFFANVSHEFRTPLTLIIGIASKLSSNIKEKESVSDLKIVNRNALKLLHLINQMLDISKLESGKYQLNVSQQDIVKFVRRSLASFESMAGQKKIKLYFNDADINQQSGFSAILIYFDDVKMEKVLYNLFSNALKFTPQNEKISVNITSGIFTINDREESAVKISVINSGPGIPPDKLPFVFDRFYQVEGSNTTKSQGTGIGLSLVKELVELHHGEINVQSIENKETELSVLLPFGKDHFETTEIVSDIEPDNSTGIEFPEKMEVLEEELEAEIKLASTEVENEDDSSLDSTTILIVEDHSDLCEFIAQNLKDEYRILEAINGVSGVAKAKEFIPDLIISDVMMPEMDGYQLCAALKKDQKTNHIPVILLTAKANVSDKMEGLETGADDYLTKPFIPDELKVRVKNLITIRRQMREKYSSEMLLKPNEVVVSSVNQEFLEKVTAVIEENLADENFGVEELGSEVGMSRSQIHRKLKALTNQPCTEFIRTFRLERGAELIIKDAGNISEITYMVGFNSQAYFTRSFQQHFNCSPLEYKKRNS